MQKTLVLCVGISETKKEMFQLWCDEQNIAVQFELKSELDLIRFENDIMGGMILIDTDRVEDPISYIFAIREYKKSESWPILILASTAFNAQKFVESGIEDKLIKPLDRELFLLKLKNMKKILELKLQVSNDDVMTEQVLSLMTLGKLASGVVHEIKTPLTLMQSKLNQFESDIATSNKMQQNEFFSSMHDLIKRVSKIIYSVQNQVYQGKDQEVMELTPLHLIFSEVLMLCNEKNKKANVKITIESYDKNLQIQCKRLDIERVLINLITNAIDALADQAKKEININVKEYENQVIIKVKDSGKPLAEEVKRNMFKDFFTTKKMGKGTGLGLSLSATVMAQHFGKLYLDQHSVETTFVIELPKIQPKKSK